MVEETNLEHGVAGSGVDPAATSLALGAASANERVAERAEEFLEKQSRLTDLQIENLQKLDEFEASHLRWRRFNDQMRGAMQIMLVAVGAAIVAAIGAAIWNASQAEGFVIEAFSVPLDYVQRGLSGDVVADDITRKLAAIRQFTNENSLSRSKEVSKDRRNDVRVEIPDTGVSVSEVWSALRNWLGNERHLTGSLRADGEGRITLALGVPGAADVSVSGPAADIGELEARAAEQVFAAIDPVNYVQYLSASGRHVEAMAAAKHFVSIATGAPERADSYALWTYTTFSATGDFALAIARAKIGIGIDPQLAAPHAELQTADFDLGRSEEALQHARIILTLSENDQLERQRSGGFAAMRERAQGRISAMLGDFSSDYTSGCLLNCSIADQIVSRAANAAHLHDPVGSRTLAAAATAAGATDEIGLGEAHYDYDMGEGNWRAAVADSKSVIAAFARPEGDVSARFTATVEATRFIPQEAIADAFGGDFAQAHRLIDATATDCYDCVVARGVIDARENNPSGAAYWYRLAAAEAPSIPFAYADWGEMLLQERKYDAAIAKFTLANQKGPHFADPLEMWGEALVRQNRSDLALAKFEEANKYAPNWGRLHLKWGDALRWSGDKPAAQRQFAIATHLDLSAADKAALTRAGAMGR